MQDTYHRQDYITDYIKGHNGGDPSQNSCGDALHVTVCTLMVKLWDDTFSKLHYKHYVKGNKNVFTLVHNHQHMCCYQCISDYLISANQYIYRHCYL